MITDEQLRKTVAEYNPRQPMDASFVHALATEVIELRARVAKADAVEAVLMGADKRLRRGADNGSLSVLGLIELKVNAYMDALDLVRTKGAK